MVNWKGVNGCGRGLIQNNVSIFTKKDRRWPHKFSLSLREKWRLQIM